jgi:hypothetical protein
VKLLPSGLILSGDPYYSPKISLCPFSFESQRTFDRFNVSGLNLMSDLFLGHKWSFVESGKFAISVALSELSLLKDDEIWIITSSGNKYVSRCVTEEISKFCNWSMEKSSKTKAAYVIHEFGRDSRELVATVAGQGIPVIEDAAYGLLTAIMSDWTFGQADFSIFSFPKAFEMQGGGILVGGRNSRIENTTELVQSFARSASNWIMDYEEIAKLRKDNHKSLVRRVEELGLQASYALNSNEVPGVFMFDAPEKTDFDEMRRFFNSHGCESTVFYGRSSYMIPVHQKIGINQINYFMELLSSYLLTEKLT